MQTRLVSPGRSCFSTLCFSGSRIRFRELLGSMNDWVGFGHYAIVMLIFELPAVGRILWRKSYRLPVDFAMFCLVTKCFLLKKPTQEAAGHMQS